MAGVSQERLLRRGDAAEEVLRGAEAAPRAAQRRGGRRGARPPARRRRQLRRRHAVLIFITSQSFPQTSTVISESSRRYTAEPLAYVSGLLT